MRRFEKISFEQFKKDIKDDKKLYESYSLPVRKTKLAAGYDLEILEDFVLEPGECIKIPTGVKFCCEPDECFMIIVRSGVGFKYNVRLTNQVGLIDADYYNNPKNEGHMWLSIQNHGTEAFYGKKGDAVCEGVFLKYLTVDNEEEILNERNGGLGSTSSNEEKEGK